MNYIHVRWKNECVGNGYNGHLRHSDMGMVTEDDKWGDFLWRVSCGHACMHHMHMGNTLRIWKMFVGLAFTKILLMLKTHKSKRPTIANFSRKTQVLLA